MGKNKPRVIRPQKRKKTFVEQNQISTLVKDFINFKIGTTNAVRDIEQSLNELKTENMNFMYFVSAFLSLFSDVLDIPIGILNQRLIFYVSERSIITPEGNIRGETIITKYNF